MLIQGGVDEAGYGPILGPLVVSLAAFEHEGERPIDLWRALGKAVTRSVPTKRSARIPVVDSKILHANGRGFAHLEATALSFTALLTGAVPATAREFLAGLGAGDLPIDGYPWYRGLFDVRLPLAADPRRVAERTERLRGAARSASVRCAGLFVSPLLEAEYSRLAERLDNKAAVLFELNARLIERVRGRANGRVHLLCDRHGGRTHYREVLERSFPMTPVTTLREDRDRSSYRLGGKAWCAVLDYCTGAESLGLEVALASILAKYTRELFVEQLNRYFRERVRGLRRTAGYYNDGLRFVDDLERHGALGPSERSRLVRSR